MPHKSAEYKIQKVINRTDWRINQILSNTFLEKVDSFLADGYQQIQKLNLPDELGAMRAYNQWLEKRITKLFK